MQRFIIITIYELLNINDYLILEVKFQTSS